MNESRGSRDWGTLVGLVLGCVALSVVSPAMLLTVPFALLCVALPPRRPVLLAIAVALFVLVLTAPDAGTLGSFQRAWCVLVGVWFVAFVLLLPSQPFLVRALSAVGATLATCGLVLAVDRGGFARVDGVVRKYLSDAATQAAASWGTALSKNEAAAQAVHDSIFRVANAQWLVFPATLALASLSACGAAWWIYRKVALRDPQPVGPLRTFRFSDHLVWVFLIGVLLVVLPGAGLAERVGFNFVLFMAALYLVRGAAVLLAVGGAPGPAGIVLAILMFLLLSPFVLAATLFVGLTDTWLDIRAKRDAAAKPGS